MHVFFVLRFPVCEEFVICADYIIFALNYKIRK